MINYYEIILIVFSAFHLDFSRINIQRMHIHSLKFSECFVPLEYIHIYLYIQRERERERGGGGRENCIYISY